ncbi:MAG: hypothetical protein J0H64_07150, partial [Actinobacteria bacterium]|nr:hypothetical protein [Actinomycetota bacterium]
LGEADSGTSRVADREEEFRVNGETCRLFAPIHWFLLVCAWARAKPSVADSLISRELLKCG